jgi:two-component system LytT family response regulator
MVVDDDPSNRRVIRILVEAHPALEWIDEAQSAEIAAEKIRREKPDALFLDIHMPGADGLELARSLPPGLKVVFVTSSESHAVEAFELDAVDYLLKPVRQERFASAVRRLRRSFHMEEGEAIPHEANDRICLRTSERTMMLPLEQIAAMVADGDFTRVLVADRPSILVCRRLGHYAEILPSPPFLRVDRSLIVHTARVQKVDRDSRASSKIWLKGLPEPIETGRTGTEHLRTALEKLPR